MNILLPESSLMRRGMGKRGTNRGEAEGGRKKGTVRRAIKGGEEKNRGGRRECKMVEGRGRRDEGKNRERRKIEEERKIRTKK